MFRTSDKKYSKEIFPNLYYFSEGSMLDCNIYLIKNKDNEFCIIDAGNGLSMDGILKSIEDLGLDLQKLKYIIITHDHLDHIMGLYPLLEKFSNLKPTIIAHSYTADLLEEGDENKIIPRLFGVSSSTFGIKVIPLKNIERKEDKNKFNFGDFSFDIIYTPGHSLGSICFYESTKKILFSGDVVFPQGSFGRYDFPGCSLNDLKNSIKKICALDINILCAGHMTPTQNNVNNQLDMSNRNIHGLFL